MEATTVSGSSAGEGADKLRKTALGVPDIVFFIVAASAPLTVIAGGVASTYLVTGNAGVPLLFLVLGAILALFVTGYAAMSQHVTNAGAFYAYVSKGIGKVAGVGTSFVALIAYNSMQIGILGLFGAVFSGFMLDKADIDFAWYTWVFVAIGADRNPRMAPSRPEREGPRDPPYDRDPRRHPVRPGRARRPGTGWPDQRRLSIPRSPSGPTWERRSASRWPPSSASSRRRSTARRPRSPARRSPRRPTSRSGVTSIFYAFSAWMLAQLGRHRRDHRARSALVEGSFATPDGAAPDPTTILFITLDTQLSTTIADIATLLFCAGLFAAMLSFHNAGRALLLRARPCGRDPEGLRPDARQRGAVHRLALRSR